MLESAEYVYLEWHMNMCIEMISNLDCVTLIAKMVEASLDWQGSSTVFDKEGVQKYIGNLMSGQENNLFMYFSGFWYNNQF